MKLTKRHFDLFWSILGLAFLLPFLLIIVLAIKLYDNGPAFFSQKRIGCKGKPFHIYKFRTMVVDAEKKGNLITVENDPRITRIGYWLRKLKLDELPQLFNVIKGDMSLVGPRPEVPKYVKLYTCKQRNVLKLMPGITDPASIKYANENEILAQAHDPEKVYIEKVMPEKIELNLEYANNATLWTDFIVILKTLFRLTSKSKFCNNIKNCKNEEKK